MRARASLGMVVALLLLSLCLVVVRLPERASAYTPHMPIYIDGNAEFTPANGVTGGNGTPVDPYIIEGWEIDTSTRNGIEIRNTDAAFVIRDVYVHANSSSYSGIFLGIAANGVIRNATIAGNYHGVYAWISTNITIESNNISGNAWFGVYLWYSTAMNIVNNTFTSDGVYIAGTSLSEYDTHAISPDNLVNGQPLYYLRDCADYAVDSIPVGQLLVVNCANVTASGLQIADSDVGMEFAYVRGATIVGNALVNQSWGGLRLYETTNATIAANNVSDNRQHSIYLSDSGGVSIASNSVLRNRDGIFIERSDTVSVVGNTASFNSRDGILLRSSDRLSVVANRITNNSVDGIDVDASTNTSIILNVIGGNRNGIRAFDALNASIFHNDFLGNTLQASDNKGVENAWDDGYPSAGNYWSDYSGVDSFSGPGQNVPGSDGIGDTPRTIDGNSRDRYPLMNPLNVTPPMAPTIASAALSGPALENLTLEWTRSPTDGIPGGTVAYRVLRSADNVSGPYVEIDTVPATGSPSYAYSCGGCGHVPGDTTWLFLKVQAVDVANNTADSNLAARYAKALAAGMNLLTVPLRQVADDLPVVLQTLGPSLASVRTYDAADAGDPWKAYVPAKGGGEIAALPFATAFWVNVTAAGQYTVAGLLADRPAIRLRAGWNLVGYVACVPETANVSLMGLNVTRVEAFTASLDPYRLRLLAMAEVLVWGEAYWILANVEDVWRQG